MSDYTLLTGVTGLLGRYLLRDLLLQGRRLVVLARSSRKASAEERVEEILQMWEEQTGRLLPRPIVLVGDICEPYLGLDEESRHWLSNHCTAAIHSAASLTFHEDMWGEPRRSNVGGVTHMLQLCQDVGITELHYVSTAYVAGLREGIVQEDELDVGQVFRNDYESSKFEAEQLVRSAKFIRNLTVYRPAVIAGDSRTGYTNTYHGLYLYLKLMSTLARNTEPGPDGVRYTPVRIELTGDEPRNVIPVDWVSAVMCHLLNTPESHGRTFHIAPEVLMTPRQMIEAGFRYFNSRGVEFVGPSEERRQPASQIERDAHDNMSMYKEYEQCDPKFDRSNLLKYAGHLPCPVIDDAMLQRFLKFGEDDRWGKRRSPPPKAYTSLGHHFQSNLCPDKSTAQSPTLNINLRVVGPGGGDWCAAICDGVLVELEPGLSPDTQLAIELDSDRFWRLHARGNELPLSELAELVRGGQELPEQALLELSNALFHTTSTTQRQLNPTT